MNEPLERKLETLEMVIKIAFAVLPLIVSMLTSLSCILSDELLIKILGKVVLCEGFDFLRAIIIVGGILIGGFFAMAGGSGINDLYDDDLPPG